jgi:hypothetical protein
MKTLIKVTTKEEINITELHIQAHVRYWEDATVNGVEDEDGRLIPCRVGSMWRPIIDVDNGIVKNWESGVTAKIHYKVCDAGSYYLKDSDGKTWMSIEDNYVPNRLIPGKYGDYIIMNIDENGQIAEWKPNPDFSDFECDEEY